MKRCLHCHSSMLPDYVDTHDAFVSAWRCLGCGRVLYVDPHREVEDRQRVEAVVRGKDFPLRRARRPR